MIEGSVVRDVVRGSRWQDNAACRGTGTNIFFADAQNKRGIREARQICDDCPVRRECLEAALAAEEGTGKSSRFGIHGGLTGPERHEVALARARQRVAAEEEGEVEPRWLQLAVEGAVLERRGWTRTAAARRLDVTPEWLRRAIQRWEAEQRADA